MPRPGTQKDNAGSTAQGRFSIKGVLQGRKERRRQEQEEAAKKITNNRAENEQAIIDVLATTNFVRSNLPKEELEFKSNPDQKWCDLEYASRAVQQKLMNSPNFSVNTEVLDTKLLQLANKFKNAVMNGDVNAAYAARGALVTCVANIRNKIPTISEELVGQFIENGAKYMESWILLVDSSLVADQLARNAETERKKYDLKLQEIEAAKAKALNEMRSNKEYLVAYDAIQNQTAPSNPMEWTEEMRTVRKMLVDQRFSELNLGMFRRMLEGQELLLQEQKSKIELLDAKVGVLPIAEDPNAMNKYLEEVDGIFDELAMIDTKIDEMVTKMEEFEGRMEVLDNAAGAVHLRNMMADQAEKFLEEIHEQQEKEVAGQGVELNRMRERMGIRSEEEQKSLIEQAQQQQRMIVQQMAVAEEQQEANFEE